MRASLFSLLLSGCLVPDALVDAYLDRDGDGHRVLGAEGGTDCDDTNTAVNPDQDESCDGLDNDCDGEVDEAGGDPTHPDHDRDGWGDPSASSVACRPPAGFVETVGDCDDGDPLRSPGLVESCGDSIDNDCDGAVDEEGEPLVWFADADGDGFGAGDALRLACAATPGQVADDTDCDDTDDTVHPGAPEVFYDGVDSDCAGGDDFDRDGDGSPRQDASGTSVDCDDTDPSIRPGAPDAWYDGVDSNCDGRDDFDADGDGFTSDGFGGQDCDDVDGQVSPAATDIPYDGIDQDCDPTNDDDVDQDGILGGPGGSDCDDTDPNNHTSCDTCIDGDDDGSHTGCDAYVTLSEDCDDTDPSRHPAAPERFGDGIDQDCSGADTDLQHAAVFVATWGTDSLTCGDAATPCQTLPHAAPLAHATDRPLFVAEGRYSAHHLDVVVFGGFDDTFSQRNTVDHPTVVEAAASASGSGVLRVEDTHLDGLSVEVSAGAGVSTTALRTLGHVHLSSVSIRLVGQASASCTGLGTSTGRLSLEDVQVLVDGCNDATGWEIAPATEHARGVDLAVSVDAVGTATGVQSGSELDLTNATVTVAGSRTAAVQAQARTGLADSTLRSTASAASPGADALVAEAGALVDVRRTTLVASGVSAATAFRINTPNAQHVENAVLAAQGGRNATAVAFSRVSDLTLVHVSLVLPDDATALDGPDGVDADVVAVNVAARGDRLFGPWLDVALEGALLDLGCLADSACLDGAVSASVWTTGSTGFDVDDKPSWRVAPAAGQDLGVDPSAWLREPTDLVGTSRPAGPGYDLGAIEARP
jgi:hypothetical protein